MPLQQVNPVQQKEQKEESAWDKIYRGLQIAETAFKIPVAWEQFKTLQKEGEIKSQELDVRKRQEQGIFSPTELAKSGMKFEPSLTPPGAQPGLAPPQGELPVLGPPAPAAEQRFSKLSKYPVKIIGPDGKPIEGMAALKDDEEKAYAQEAALRKEYGDVDAIKIAEQAVLNHSNAIRGLKQGGKEGDLLALGNVMRLYNPGVMKAADGSTIANADSMLGELEKKFKELTTGEKQILDDNERANLLKLSNEAMQFYGGKAQEFAEQKKSLAEQSGFLPKNIGYKNYLDGIEKSGSVTKKSDGSKSSTDKPPVTQNGHIYYWNEKTKKYE